MSKHRELFTQEPKIIENLKETEINVFKINLKPKESGEGTTKKKQDVMRKKINEFEKEPIEFLEVKI